MISKLILLLALSFTLSSQIDWQQDKLKFLWEQSGPEGLDIAQLVLQKQLRNIQSMVNSRLFNKVYKLNQQLEQQKKAGASNDAVCNSCQNLMKDIVDLPENKRVFSFLANIFTYICKFVVDEEICTGVTNEFGVVLIESLLNRLFNPTNFCNSHDYCDQYQEKALLVKDFATRVLANKPVPSPKKPTNRKTYKILHLTDTHIDLQYQEGYNSDCTEPFCCRKENGSPSSNSTTSGKWGSLAKCDIPIATLEQSLIQIKETIQPDFIIWTGDSQNHDIWSQNKLNQTQPQKMITRLVQKHLPSVQMYPMFGNHECYPVDIFDFHSNYSDLLKQQSAQMWSSYLSPSSQQSLMSNGFYSQVDKEKNLRMIALNTQACDNINFFLFANNTDPGNQLYWLEQELQQAEQLDQQAILFGHIPPGDDFCSSHWAQRYNILIERYSNNVAAQIFGHTHKDQLEVQNAYDTYPPTSVGNIFISPSMTTYSFLNPSFRIFHMDADTNTVLDYDQYRLDILKANRDNLDTIVFDKAYSFKATYKVSDMSHQSIYKMVNNMEYDQNLLITYIRNFYANGVKAQEDIDNVSTTDIKKNFICLAKYATYDDSMACLGTSIKSYKARILYKVFERIQGQWITLIKQ